MSEDAADAPGDRLPDAGGGRRRRRLPGHAVAAALFAAATLVALAPVWRAGPSHTVAVKETQGAFRITSRADAIFQAWLTARNARTLLTAPHRLFDAEHCAPAERTLTLGIPMVTQGLLGIPARLLTREPVLVYNLSLALQTFVSAFAMYLLVVRWTGSTGAGLVAGLLFGLSPLRLGNVTHPSVWDISWTVLALFFAERLLATGRWRDALGLAAALALQIGASFYPLVAATLLAPPLAAWLLHRHGLRRPHPAQLAFVAAVVVLASAAVLGPYLGARAEGGELVRSRFDYLEWAALASPGTLVFPGWTVLALAGVALLAGARRAAPGTGGDPRWVLLLGALLVGAVAAGPHNRYLLAWVTSPEVAARLPNLHAALAAVLPGLDAVRGVVRLTAGMHLALILLAGLGAGVLVRAAGRRGAVAAAALCAVAAFDVLRPPAPGVAPRYRWLLEEIRPEPEAIAFFETLERRGDRGPLLELPLGDDHHIRSAPERILLSAWHGRRTSACFGSYLPPDRDALRRVVEALPGADALDALTAAGFTTAVVHLDAGPPALRARAALDAAVDADPRVVPLHATRDLAAWRLRRSGEDGGGERRGSIGR